MACTFCSAINSLPKLGKTDTNTHYLRLRRPRLRSDPMVGLGETTPSRRDAGHLGSALETCRNHSLSQELWALPRKTTIRISHINIMSCATVNVLCSAAINVQC